MRPMTELLQKIFPWLDQQATTLIFYGAILLFGLVALGSIPASIRRWRRRRRWHPIEDLSINIAALPPKGPPSTPPTLEFLHVPMRLAVAVFAPAGRAADIPPQEHWGELFDAIVPGLEQVAKAHQPKLLEWPVQLSATGFSNRLYQELHLPGDQGKNTPWCAVAGTFCYQDTPMLVGLVLCASQPDRHRKYVIENENEWLGMIRVRL